MSDKKNKKKEVNTMSRDDSDNWINSLRDKQEVKDKPVEATSTIAKEKNKPLYKDYLWKGVKTVYLCEKCSYNNESEDDMKLHVLTHYPEKDREKILNQLTKEK